ncbi:DNA-directed DNA polymerase [Vibrio parahaemolyticus]
MTTETAEATEIIENTKPAETTDTLSFSPILGVQAAKRATDTAQLHNLIESWQKRFDLGKQQDKSLELQTYLENRKLPPKSFQALKSELAQYLKDRKSRFKFLKAKGGNIHIGIDTEFEYDEEAECNKILSYQYCLLTPDGKEYKGIDYPASAKKEDRFEFNDYLFKIIVRARKMGWITEYPENTFVYCHFMRADLASFHAYWNIKGSKKYDAAMATVNNARGDYGLDLRAIGASQYKPRAITYTNHNKRPEITSIHLKDTLFLSPGRCALSVIGDAIGIEKVELPDGYSIERMSQLLEEDKGSFEKYAITDAKITVKFGRFMEDVVLEELNSITGIASSGDGKRATNQIKYLPNTLGNLSVALFKNVSSDVYEQRKESKQTPNLTLNEVFGLEEVTAYKWDESSNRSIPNKLVVLSGERDRNEATARRCFFGGRNEDYYFGPSPKGEISDWDLVGAYTTGLCDIKPVDYRKAYSSTNIEDYLGHVMGFAYVRFRFKEGTRFPSLPVRTELYGLYYPLEGETYCTAPEIAVAYNMGCELEILYGDIIPWIDDAEPVFEPFTKVIRELRKKHKGTFLEAVYKDVGNTLYGKVGQNVGFQRNKFDTKSGLSRPATNSPVTNSYFSSHVTGFIRGVLSELLANVGDDKRVYSATTDGLLTDLSDGEAMLIDEYHLNGQSYQSVTARFKALCEKFGDESMLALKHQVGQIIGMKTRGQLTAEILDADINTPELNKIRKKVITAKAGVKPPRDCEDENAWMVDLFLNRKPSQRISNNCLVPERDMYLHELDLYEIKRDRFMNLEFDFKRRPVNPTMVDVRDPKTGCIVSHLAFDTVPWKNREEGEMARATFDGWRKGKKSGDSRVGANCLKTMEDWYNWIDFYKIKAVMKVKGQNYENNSSEGIFKRYILTAITNEFGGLSRVNRQGKRRTNAELAELFTSAGYPTNEKDVSNAKGRKLHSQMLPAAPKFMPMLRWAMTQFPDLELKMFFMPEELGEVLALLDQ